MFDKNIYLPTRTIGTEPQKCLHSGIHFCKIDAEKINFKNVTHLPQQCSWSCRGCRWRNIPKWYRCMDRRMVEVGQKPRLRVCRTTSIQTVVCMKFMHSMAHLLLFVHWSRYQYHGYHTGIQDYRRTIVLQPWLASNRTCLEYLLYKNLNEARRKGFLPQPLSPTMTTFRFFLYT